VSGPGGAQSEGEEERDQLRGPGADAGGGDGDAMLGGDGKDDFGTVPTVKSPTQSIYRKLSANNRDQAVTRARELQLIG
jgi:hypothetical protein